MALLTVGDVITQARVLLQDTDPVPSYRYDDVSLYQALNQGLLESRKLRPDLFRANPSHVPQYSPSQAAQGIAYEQMYIPALINYIVGRAQLRDAEETTDARAGALLTSFTQKLLTMM